MATFLEQVYFLPPYNLSPEVQKLLKTEFHKLLTFHRNRPRVWAGRDKLIWTAAAQAPALDQKMCSQLPRSELCKFPSLIKKFFLKEVFSNDDYLTSVSHFP